MKRVLAILLMSACLIFITSCGTDSAFESFVNKPTPKVSTQADTPSPVKSPINLDKTRELDPIEPIPTEVVPSNPETWAAGSVLPALTNPLNPQDDSGKLAALPIEEQANKDAVVSKETSSDVEGKKLAAKEKSELEQQLAESKAQNTKLVEENSGLKQSLAVASEHESTAQNLRKELDQTRKELRESTQGDKVEPATNNALFLTIHQPETENIANKELLVGVLSVPAENNQKLGEFENVGTVRANRSGILTIRDKIPGKEGIVAEYNLDENSDCVLSIPQDLPLLLGVPKDWGITFKPTTGSVSMDTEDSEDTETTILDFSLSGAMLKDGSRPWISNSTLRWFVKTAEPDQVLVTKNQNHSSQTATSEIWWKQDWAITLIGVLLVMLLLFVIVKSFQKSNWYSNFAQGVAKSATSSTTKSVTDRSERKKSSRSKPILMGILDPSGKKDFESPSPFKLAPQDDALDDIGEIDGPEPKVTLPPPTKVILPPPREVPLSEPTKQRGGVPNPDEFETLRLRRRRGSPIGSF